MKMNCLSTNQQKYTMVQDGAVAAAALRAEKKVGGEHVGATATTNKSK
jgi:hypothetical protein